jgi:hypothetical protein
MTLTQLGFLIDEQDWAKEVFEWFPLSLDEITLQIGESSVFAFSHLSLHPGVADL